MAEGAARLAHRTDPGVPSGAHGKFLLIAACMPGRPLAWHRRRARCRRRGEVDALSRDHGPARDPRAPPQVPDPAAETRYIISSPAWRLISSGVSLIAECPTWDGKSTAGSARRLLSPREAQPIQPGRRQLPFGSGRHSHRPPAEEINRSPHKKLLIWEVALESA